MEMNRMDCREATGPERFRNAAEAKDDLRLRDAAQQFEGMLLGIMLKEALRDNLSGSDGDSAAGFDQFREFCVEQVAHSLSGSASMGIADQLYEQMSQQGSSK